jgi:hypothetical protein
VAEGLVLDPPAHLVEAAVAGPHDVEGIGHSAGMVQMRRQPGPEGLS